MTDEIYNPDIQMTLECLLNVKGVLKDEITISDHVIGKLRIFIDGKLSQEVTSTFKIKGIISNE